jgi:sulfonate transport system substrate-binding protein
MTHDPLRPLRALRSSPRSRSVAAATAIVGTLAALSACGAASDAKTAQLSLTAALPDKVPSGTVLRVGDPSVQAALQASGIQKQLDDEGVKLQYANLSGGPETIEAFRGNKLDCGAVADIPSLFAAWTGTSTKIVFQAVTVDPLQHPTYKLGVAPGVTVNSLADLRGKKIAYSPGQAQGALVLRLLQKAGLTKDDVQLVEMTSTADSFVTALGSKAVDVAPIGQALEKEYRTKYPTGTAINTGIRDDAETLYCLTSSVQDAGKAAALKDYVAARTKAILWANSHPDEYAKAYYQDVEGLSAPDAVETVKEVGQTGIPASWDNAITRLQQTADLLSEQQGQPKLDVNTLIDRRFEKVETRAAGSDVVKGDAS